MTTEERIAQLEARVRTLELAAGLPRRVPVYACSYACGFEVALLSGDRPTNCDGYEAACPRCGTCSLLVARTTIWPEETNP
jgi:hypothetical protein